MMIPEVASRLIKADDNKFYFELFLYEPWEAGESKKYLIGIFGPYSNEETATEQLNKSSKEALEFFKEKNESKLRAMKLVEDLKNSIRQECGFDYESKSVSREIFYILFFISALVLAVALTR